MRRPAVPLLLASAALAMTALLCGAPGAARAERIKEIVVVENTKTTEDTVRYIAGIHEGDDWSQDVQEKVRAELISSGLFKEVDLFSEPHPKGGGVKVTIIAKDKHSWVVAPTIYNQPTNKGAGAGFGENNLFGENKKLLLYGQIATGDSFFVSAYVDPSIGGTPFSWQVDLFLRYERIIEYDAPVKLTSDVDPLRESKMMYLNSGLKFGVTLFRSLKLEQRLRGAKVAFHKTALREGRTAEEVCGGPCPDGRLPEPGQEGWDVSTETILTFDRRANWYGITSGSRLRFSYEQSLPSFGADYDYWTGSFSFERARRYFSRHNFIIRGSAGHGKNLPFQQEFTGGGTSLRGYENKQFRGDTKVAGNAEYSVPLFTVSGFSTRGLVFFDTSYVGFFAIDPSSQHRHYLPNHDARQDNVSSMAPFKNSVGGGIRLYLRQIVLPLLGLDFGYGLESGGLEMYLAIGLTDF
jgi:outer membrane protein insertion porin family